MIGLKPDILECLRNDNTTEKQLGLYNHYIRLDQYKSTYKLYVDLRKPKSKVSISNRKGGFNRIYVKQKIAGRK
jgi:hypothetical protein